jgi:hypothetical protein
MTWLMTPYGSSMAAPYPLFGSRRGCPFGKGHLWPLGRPPLRNPAPKRCGGCLEFDYLAQGRVTFAVTYDWTDRNRERELHDHYGAPDYWEDQSVRRTFETAAAR